MFLSNKSSLFRYTLIAGLALSFVACKDEEEPEPRIGSISGAVEGVSKVTAINAGNAEYVATMGSNGRFAIGNLPAGDYTVKFTAAPGFAAPEDIAKVPVTGNVGTELGNIEAERNATFSFKIGTNTVTDEGEIYASLQDNGTLNFSSDDIYVNGAYHKLMFSIENFTGPATYSFTADPNNDNSASYSSGGSSWNSDADGAVVITEYDEENGLISGTFEFEGMQFGSTVPRTIADGKFTDIHIMD